MRDLVITFSGRRQVFHEFKHGRVLTREALLERVWGDSAYRDIRTVDVHIRHLREKIEPDASNPEYILTVRNVGYRFRDE